MIQPAVPDPPEIFDQLWEDFGPGRVAFDVGANCGQTLPTIGVRFEKVVAFEPAVEALEYLEAHFGDHPNVTIEPYAVTSADGEVDLMAAPSKIETGQLVTHGTAGMEWSDDEMVNGEIRTVPAITIDTYAGYNDLEPDFIKIDVEGHELEVLRGAKAVLKMFTPQLLIEVHSEQLGHDIWKLLSHHYRIETIRHPHYEHGSLLWRTHFWYRCFPLDA